METTTIKLKINTKVDLDKLREENESYDQIVAKLMMISTQKNLKNELVEAYTSKANKDLSILEEWETASNELTND